MLTGEWMMTWFVSTFMTLAILTFVFKDNVFFRFAEHFFTGWTIGYILFIGLDQINTMTLTPIITGTRPILIIAVFFGLLMFTQFNRKSAFLVRWPTAIMIGSTLAVAVTTGMESNVISQLSAAFSLPITIANPTKSLSNIIEILMVVFSLLYFFFSLMGGRTERAPMKQIIKFSRYVVLFGMGAFFGSAMMGDTIKLINRFDQVFTAIRLLFT